MMNLAKSSSKEIKSLTGVRGIAALIVALHHFISKYYITSLEENTHSFYGYFLYNYANHGYLMVELFFILSGFVLALSYDGKFENNLLSGYKNFMVKRFNRIYPLYFASTIIYFFLFNKDLWGKPDVLIVNFLFLEVWLPKIYTLNNVSWSLCTEWFLYLIFPFFLMTSWFKRDKYILFGFLSVLCLGLSPVLNTQYLYDTIRYDFFELRMSNGTGAFLRCLGSYFLGISMFLIYKNHLKITQTISKYWYLLVLLILIFYGLEKSDIIITLLFGLLIVSLTSRNSLSKFLGNRFMYFFGLISYSVYLNHMIFLRILAFSFKSTIWKESDLNLGIGLVFYLAATILLSWGTYSYLEVPVGKWLNSKVKR